MKKQMQQAAGSMQGADSIRCEHDKIFEDLLRSMTCLERLRQLQRQAQQWNFVDGCHHLPRNDSDVGDVDTTIARNREKSREKSKKEQKEQKEQNPKEFECKRKAVISNLSQ